MNFKRKHDVTYPSGTGIIMIIITELLHFQTNIDNFTFAPF